MNNPVTELFRSWQPYWLDKAFSRVPAQKSYPLDSVVIPCVGKDFTEEAVLAGNFAVRNLKAGTEVIIYTDCSRESFPGLDSQVEVKSVKLPECSRENYTQVWQSRIMKIRAPLQASGECVMLMDSDIMLVKPFAPSVMKGKLYGSFRRGGVGRIARRVQSWYPRAEKTVRGKVRWHLNGGMLIAEADTWKKLSLRWEEVYREIWSIDREEGTPSDQLPLALSLEDLGLSSVDIGQMPNWSVAKHFDYLGKHHKLPPAVIGVHGGFPLSEWRRYRDDPSTELHFEIKGMAEKRYKR